MDFELDEIFKSDRELNDIRLQIIEIQNKIQIKNKERAELTAKLSNLKNEISKRKIMLRRKYGKEM